jgi:iron complex transport system substrate-binding protein
MRRVKAGPHIRLAALVASHFIFGVAIASFSLSAPVAAQIASPPSRIVSLNVCIDQILVDLVPHARIAAVTHLAADPLSSAHPENAVGIPITRGDAEDVLSRDPDLILAGQFTTPATVDLLRRLGKRVELIAFPDSIAGVRSVILQIAAAVGAEARGAALVAGLDQRLAAAQSPIIGPHAPTALVYQVNHYVSGTFGLVDEALRIAGWRNGAGAMAITRSGQVTLESLVTTPPDLLIFASAPETYRTAVADNLRHPVLARLQRQVGSVVVPWPLMLCGTHHIAEAVEAMVAARLAFQNKRGRP